jgi:hypothetical protein
MKPDIIEVKVNGVGYPTHIDDQGVQRFVGNGVLLHLYESGSIDMNQLRREYHQAKFSQKDYMEFHIGIGYSVHGFCDLSVFEDVIVENPVWEDPMWEKMWDK